jgi:hypothetical protein
MKVVRYLLTIGAAAASLFCPRALADDPTTTPPTVVPADRDDRDLLRDLKGAPANVKTLILNFDQTADKYLAQQRQLLLKLKNATTTDQRQAIRDQLQQNRQAFLAELKTFRQQLRDDLQALKGKITHPELKRILDAAKDAGPDPSHPRKGQK